ncbi:MAG: hypothetical protein R3E12_00955 [Candidatus Eisenbacteria bacterium]
MASSSLLSEPALGRRARWIAAACGLLSLLPSTPARAEVLARSTLFYTVPRLAQLQITGDVSQLLTLSADGSAEAAYEAGYIDSDPDATVLTLDTTEAWDLSARLSGDWVCPGTYDKDENDLRIRISNTPSGTIQNGADSYVTLGGVDLMILSDGAGTSNNTVDVQTQVSLDWAQDVPGAYSIGVTYTLVGHIP